MGIEFPSVKLIDYLGREEELAASRNPFALMTQAFLSTRATRDDGERRRIWKLRDRPRALGCAAAKSSSRRRPSGS